MPVAVENLKILKNGLAASDEAPSLAWISVCNPWAQGTQQSCKESNTAGELGSKQAVTRDKPVLRLMS